jgi:ABC-2 type transport system permease protein
MVARPTGTHRYNFVKDSRVLTGTPSPSATTLLEIESLRKAYRGAARPAFELIDLQVREGGFFGLLGSNGAGKTTLISIVSGILAADGGRVALRDASGRFVDPVGARGFVGLVPQELAFYPSLSVIENLRFFGAMQGLGRLLAIEVETTFARLAGGGVATSAPRASGLLTLDDRAELANGRGSTVPTTTQHNVRAYSLLAVFMLVVPLSGTFIKEREQGSLTRLRSIQVPAWIIVGGKVLPYFMINQLQLLLCLLVGRYVVPWMGGEALRFGDSIGGIVLLSVAASLAAIGFGLVVAMFARTAEQASAFGATAILMLAALGGIMVPKILMPVTLRNVAAFSPLGWALDGFLDLFARGADAAAVAPRASALVAFAGVCLALTAWRFSTYARQT